MCKSPADPPLMHGEAAGLEEVCGLRRRADEGGERGSIQTVR